MRLCALQVCRLEKVNRNFCFKRSPQLSRKNRLSRRYYIKLEQAQWAKKAVIMTSSLHAKFGHTQAQPTYN